MQEVFEELLEATEWLRIYHWQCYEHYEHWGENRHVYLTHRRIRRVAYAGHRVWQMNASLVRGVVANFSAYVRHHQNQYNNNE